MRTSYEKVLRFAAQMVMNTNESQMADLKSALGEKAVKTSAYKKREAENIAISKAWFEENYDALYDLLRERPEWFNESNI